MDKENRFCYDLYQYQFIFGCEKIECSHPYCNSNPKSCIQKMTILEKQKKAKEFSENQNRFSYLCDGIPNHIKSHKSYRLLDSFANWVSTLNQNLVKDYESVVINMSIAFKSQETYPYIILCNNIPLSMKNHSICEEKFVNFSSIIASNPDLNEFLSDIFQSLVADIVKSLKDNKYSSIRALLYVFFFPPIMSQDKVNQMLFPLLKVFSNLNPEVKRIIKEWLSSLPVLRNTILGVCHYAISIHYSNKTNPNPHHQNILYVVNLMKILHQANTRSNNKIPISMFYNHHINESLDPYNMILFPRSMSLINFLDYPFILSMKTKASLLKYESKKAQKHFTRLSSSHGRCISLSNKENLILKIRRENLIQDAINQILSKNHTLFHYKLRVVFVGERAIDAGGPSREFLFLLTERLFSLDYGMFINAKHGKKWFSQSTFEGDRSFFLVGAIIGLAIHNGIVLPIRFPYILYKKLFHPNREISVNDIMDINPNLFHSLNHLLTMKRFNEDISDLCLTFDINIDMIGQNKVISLIENKSGVPLTNDNVEQYVNLYTEWELIKSIESQFCSFKRGFELACQDRCIRMFEPEEIDLLVSGEEAMNWELLKKSTKYLYTSENSDTIQMFWQIFDEMTLQEKRSFLKFSTGNDRIPSCSTKPYKLTISITQGSNRLPIAHTCFKILELPSYNNKETMKQKLIRAITETEGFGLV